MLSSDLYFKAKEYRRLAQQCRDPIVWQALLELADACEELAREEAADGAPDLPRLSALDRDRSNLLVVVALKAD